MRPEPTHAYEPGPMLPDGASVRIGPSGAMSIGLVWIAALAATQAVLAEDLWPLTVVAPTSAGLIVGALARLSLGTAAIRGFVTAYLGFIVGTIVFGAIRYLPSRGDGWLLLVAGLLVGVVFGLLSGSLGAIGAIIASVTVRRLAPPRP